MLSAIQPLQHRVGEKKLDFISGSLWRLLHFNGGGSTAHRAVDLQKHILHRWNTLQHKILFYWSVSPLCREICSR